MYINDKFMSVGCVERQQVLQVLNLNKNFTRQNTPENLIISPMPEKYTYTAYSTKCLSKTIRRISYRSKGFIFMCCDNLLHAPWGWVLYTTLRLVQNMSKNDTANVYSRTVRANIFLYTLYVHNRYIYRTRIHKADGFTEKASH